MNNINIGKIGEEIANNYLGANKYMILARNHRERSDEIDIIARNNKGTLVFCEVKTINNKSGYFNEFMPEDNLSNIKRHKMIRAAEAFIGQHPWLVRDGAGWQIDLIAVVLQEEKLINLRHYENI